jgi:hypothetical protein
MTTTVRPGKYLIEKTRRSLVGVIARVGTGGSVPAPVQQAINTYIDSAVDAGKAVRASEHQIVRQGMKKMQGTWMILSVGAGLRWVTIGFASWEKEISGIQNALKGTGWNPPKTLLAQLVMGPEPGEPGVKASKYRHSKKK